MSGYDSADVLDQDTKEVYTSGYDSASDLIASQAAATKANPYDAAEILDSVPHAESKDQPAAGAGGAVPAGPDRSAQILALTAEATDMLSNKRDWNAEYQVLLDKLSLAPPASQPAIDATVAVHKLFNAFCTACRTLGRVIIIEHFLAMTNPNYNKLIKSVDVGGIAGGEKFIAHGIFFKRVSDSLGIYGSDENAMKVAGHERRGMRAYVEIDPQLRTPLMTIVDYRGFRLIAMAVLPGIGKTSLIYGSPDAGKTVMNDPRVSDLMAAAGAKIGIKKHKVGKDPTKLTELVGPCDVEVHVLPDAAVPAGRYYVLDSARIFPPTRPEDFHRGLLIPIKGMLNPLDIDLENTNKAIVKALGVKENDPIGMVTFNSGASVYFGSNSNDSVNVRASQLCGRDIRGAALFLRPRRGQHLFMQLRPEFVKHYAHKFGVPLSSDAFSMFGINGAEVHNAEVEKACQYLAKDMVMQLARDMAIRAIYITNGRQLCDLMHERGINVRLLPAVRLALPKHYTRERSMVLTEMVVRVAKSHLRLILRGVRDADENTVRTVVTRFLNVMFGGSDVSQFFWRVQMQVGLRDKFGQWWGEDDNTAYGPAVTSCRVAVDEGVLFRSLQQRTGVYLTTEVNDRMAENPASFYTAHHPIKPEDVEKVVVQDKRLYWDELRTLDAFRQHFVPKDNTPEAVLEAATDMHLAVVKAFGENHRQVGLSHVVLASKYYNDAILPTTAAKMAPFRLEAAWEHVDKGWAILAPKLVEGDARIATLMLRSDILDALKRYKEAHEASLLAFEATYAAYGAVMKTSMDKISRPGVDDDGSGDVSTQWTSTSVVRGHPVYAVVANRIAHYNKEHGFEFPTRVWLEARVALTSYPLPPDPVMRTRLFGEPEPLIVLKAFSSSGTDAPAERAKALETAENTFKSSRTMNATLSRTKYQMDASIEEVQQQQDEALVDETLKFRNVEQLCRHAILVDESPVTKERAFLAENKSMGKADEIKTDSVTITTLPDHMLFAEGVKFEPEAQDKYWRAWPIGTYCKMRTVYDYDMPTGKFTTVSEFYSILSSKLDNGCVTHRVEYAPTPCIKATRTPLNGVTILSRKNLGKEEVNCGDAGHLAAEKVESQLVIDSQQGKHKFDYVAWMPADEALRARVCQPLRFTSTALIAAGAATTKVVSSERVIELNAVEEVDGKKMPCFHLQRHMTIDTNAPTVLDEWMSTKVPGGQIKHRSDNATMPGMKIIMSTELLSFGQFSDAELQEYKTKYVFETD